jgi:hypothetical protein
MRTIEAAPAMSLLGHMQIYPPIAGVSVSAFVLLTALVLLVRGKLGLDLFVTPVEFFSLAVPKPV